MSDGDQESSHTKNKKQEPVSRRTMIETIGAAAIVGASSYVARSKFDPSVQEPTHGSIQDIPIAIDENNFPLEKGVEVAHIPAFDDKETNEIAHDLGIYAENFFVSNKEIMDKLHAFNDDTLYPVFPPSVIKHKKLIYQLAQEHKVPPNVIATIMTIESCGINTAKSGVGAQGLFQVMPENFEKEKIMNPNHWNDPKINGDVAMKVLQWNVDFVRGKLSGYPPNHALIYIRSLLVYNRGPKGATDVFDDLPEETQYYGDHAMRIFTTMEIAKALRKRGFTDTHIQHKLISSEINKRADVLYTYRRKTQDFSYESYIKIIHELVKSVPGVDNSGAETSGIGKFVHNFYQQYKKPNNDLPISPGLAIWIALGGGGLFYDDSNDINANVKDWESISTAKPQLASASVR